MKNFKSVLAFGDSHVAGCELSNEATLTDYLSGLISLEQADAGGRKLAFPSIVANKLDIPCYNYAISGGSNQRSIRKMIQAVQQHPNSLVIFGWTCTDRYEFYYPDEGAFLGRDDDNYIQVGMQWYGLIQSVPARIKHPINDVFVKNILRPVSNLDDLKFIVDNVATLNSKAIRHVPLFPESVFSDMDDVVNLHGGNYLDWCAEQKFERLPFLHYNQDAHNALADIILESL
jgi:hypothetical protein